MIAAFRFASPLAKTEAAAKAWAFGRFTPQVALRQGGEEASGFFLDLTRSQRIFPPPVFQARATALARRLGLQGEWGIDASSAAWSWARTFSAQPKTLGLEHLPVFLDPFRVLSEEDDRWMRKMRVHLEELGVEHVSAVLALSPAAMLTRFGKSSLVILDRMRMHAQAPWPVEPPPAKLLASADVEEAELDGLLFVLRRLCDELMARLRGQSRRAAELRISFEFAPWGRVPPPPVTQRVELAIPQGSSPAVMTILRERLAAWIARAPIRAPVSRIELEILHTVPGRGAQREFFSRSELEAEAWDAMLDQLIRQCGKSSVFQPAMKATHVPEEMPMRTLEPMSAENVTLFAALPARPSRLFAPRPVDPQSFFWMDGPERIATAWWDRGGVERDYYRVETLAGEQLWVFQDLENGKFFVQGAFD